MKALFLLLIISIYTHTHTPNDDDDYDYHSHHSHTAHTGETYHFRDYRTHPHTYAYYTDTDKHTPTTDVEDHNVIYLMMMM